MSGPKAPAAGSVSKVECLVTVRGKGTARIYLLRHLAPLTVNAILRSLPFDSRVSAQPEMTCLFTDIRVGVEKPRTTLTRGDIAFLPSGGLLCFFVKDTRSDRPLNPVGRIEDGLAVFDQVGPGDTVRLSLA